MSTEGRPFKDHFSGHAGDYAAYRPTYPASLFEWLAQESPGRTLAWDCACGNGQAAVSLAAYFERVYATDASPEQIREAAAHPRVEYAVAGAEHSGLPDGSVDLLTVAQAYHWFDHDAFHTEAVRVLRPGGVMAVWAYSLAQIDDRVDDVMFELFDERLAGYWPPERTYVDNGYRDLELPFAQLESPSFEMTAEWTLTVLLSYLGTWSSVRRYITSNGIDPVEDLRGAFTTAWGRGDSPRQVRWPLILRACRKPGA